MGYYAYASGKITLKKTVEKLRAVLDKIFDTSDFLYKCKDSIVRRGG